MEDPSSSSSSKKLPPGGSSQGLSPRQEQKEGERQPVAQEDTSLEPRRVELPMPGQELSAASPSFQRMVKRHK